MRIITLKLVLFVCVMLSLLFASYLLLLFVQEGTFKNAFEKKPADFDNWLKHNRSTLNISTSCLMGGGKSVCEGFYHVDKLIASYYRGKDIPDDILSMEQPRFLSNYKNPCWYEWQGDTHNKTLRCLPYFHVIGVDKCGTTDFWSRLTRHPQIVTPRAVFGKETHWWSWRRFGFDIWIKSNPIEHFNTYVHRFDKPARKIESHLAPDNSNIHHLITGEGSPTVFWDFTGWDRIPQNLNRTPENAFLTPDCIKHLTPQVKLIVLFRDPKIRLYSDYIFLDIFKSNHNISVQNFHQGVMRSIDMLRSCVSHHTLLYCIYNKQLHMEIPVRIIVGMYDIFLDKWLQVFSKDQVLIIRNEDYSKNILHYIQKAFEFLGLNSLDSSHLNEIEHLPRAFQTLKLKALGPMMNETKAILDKFYSQHKLQLAKILNDSRYEWLE